MIRVSVVVPTSRRPDQLEACIAALATQSLPARQYEIIVVDDAPDVETRRQLAHWIGGGLPDIRYVPVAGPAHGPAAARNAGWRAARADLIAFTDDDTIPQREWLDRGIEGFDNARLQAAWGRVRVPLPPAPTDYERDVAGLERAGFVTANCFVRKNVLERVGGFDETFRDAWREDSDLFFRLLRIDCCVDYLSDAVVVHPVRRAKWGVSLAQQRKVEYDALLYRKDPKMYERFVRPGRPWLYYPIVLSLAAMIVGAVANRRSVITEAALAWVALTVWLALRRLKGTSLAPAHVAEMLFTSALIPALSVYHRTRGAVKHRVFFW